VVVPGAEAPRPLPARIVPSSDAKPATEPSPDPAHAPTP